MNILKRTISKDLLKTNIIIVGAGPAGSMAALNSRSDTILIDQRPVVGIPKQCAEGVPEGFFNKIGMNPKKEWISKEIKHVLLVSPFGREIRISSGKVKRRCGYVLNRKVFDRDLAEKARDRGAELLLGTRAIKAKRIQKGIKVYTNKNILIEGKILIACDGMQSSISKSLGIDTSLSQGEIGACYQYEMDNIEVEDAIELYFGRGYAPGGYAWIFPKGENSANVGVGVDPSVASRSPKWYLDRFLKKDRVKGGNITEINAGAVSVLGPLEKTYADNLMICGDAARMTNPLGGGGIATACTAGTLAGNVATEAIKQEDYSAAFLYKYQMQWESKFRKDLAISKKARKIYMELSDRDIDGIFCSLDEADLEQGVSMRLITRIIRKNPRLLLKLGAILG